MSRIGLICLLVVVLARGVNAETLPPLTNGVPQDVEELWAEIDLESEPLDTEILHSYEQDGVTLQVVRYRVGVFNGATAMVAGVYGYPTGQTDLPALLNIHGGGQFATANACFRNAKRGYTTLSVAWAGRINAQDYFVNNAIRDIYWAGDTNHPQYTVTTGWTGLSQDTGLTPKTNTYDNVESPRNSGWFLWAMAARRGLTFLEQQPEADGDRLGVYGHSMGGKLTVMTAGSDDRLKAAAPSCGGVSDIYDGALENATIGDSNYLSGVSSPIFLLKPANDFHGHIEDVPQAINQVDTNDWRVCSSPHHNHQDHAEYEVATLIWMDQYLKSGMVVPDSPGAALTLNPGGGVPSVTVTVDTNRMVQSVDVFHTQMGEDPGEQQHFNENIYRHWHYSAVQGTGDTWTAEVPVLSTNEPLWVYANVTYALDAPITGAGYYYQDYTANEFVLSTPLEMVTSAELRAAGVVETLSVTNLIEDFQGDWEKEWFDYSRDTYEWAVTTHKVNDPVYEAPALAKLSLEVKSAASNTLLLTMNGSGTASVEVPGGTEWQLIELLPMQFDDGGSPWAYDFAGAKEFRLSSGSTPAWSGPAPEFRNLHWAAATQQEYDDFGVPGEFVQRNTAPDTWTDWTVNGWYSESSEVRLPASNDWARIHYNRHTFVTNSAFTIARLDMFWLGGADLRIDNGGTLTVSAAGGFDGSITLSGPGSNAGNPNTGDISVETDGSLVSGNTGTRTVLNGDSSQLGSLSLNGGTFTAQGSSDTNNLHLQHSVINFNSGTFDMTGGQTEPDGVVFNINGEGTDIDFGWLNNSGAASDYNFTLGSSGVSGIDISGWAQLSQAKMVVDGSSYTGGVQDITLFASTNLASTMNPANITVINFPEWASATVEQDDVTTHDVILHIAMAAPTIETVLYSHDFEDGTHGGWSPGFTEIHSTNGTYDVDSSLTSIVENVYAVIYANQMAVLTLDHTFAEDSTYTFSLDHFARAGQAAPFGGEAIKLQIGYDADGSGTWTWLADQFFPETGANPATLLRREISYEATTGGAELGKRIMLRVLDADSSGHVTGNQAGIDNILLMASSTTLGDITLGSMADGDMVFSWSTAPGQIYNVLTNADLMTPNWGVAETIVGDGNPVWVTNTPAGPQLFYIVASQ